VLLGAIRFLLLSIAGVRFGFLFGAAWYIADDEIRRQFYRDLIWLPPR
jgi:hypothetical protein